jgi:hypothetical protein
LARHPRHVSSNLSFARTAFFLSKHLKLINNLSVIAAYDFARRPKPAHGLTD